jgi:hypothetical protein
MGSVISSLELLHLRSLVIIHKGGQAYTTFRTLPWRYLSPSRNILLRLIYW